MKPLTGIRPAPRPVERPETLRLLGVEPICALLRWDARIDREQARRAARVRGQANLGPRPASSAAPR